MSSEPKRTRRRIRVVTRICVVLLLCFAGAWALRIPTDPTRDLAEIILLAEDDGGHNHRFQYKGAYIFFHSKGYVLALCVRGDERFDPAVFLTIISTSGDLSATELTPVGDSSSEVMLEGVAARSYLERVHIDLDPVDQVYRRYYRRAPSEPSGK